MESSWPVEDKRKVFQGEHNTFILHVEREQRGPSDLGNIQQATADITAIK